MQLRRSITIQAAPALVARLYAEPTGWPEIYPNIHAVSIVKRVPAGVIVGVRHDDGIVRNVLTHVAVNELRLFEDKHRYTATFDVRFVAVAEGTRVDLTARVRIKGALRVLAVFARPYARRKIDEGQLVPLKRAAERPASTLASEAGCDHASHT